MDRPLLIIVSGYSGAGKTVLGKRLATELKLPLIGRDTIKESLFDTLGWSDREWSKKLGAASYGLLYIFIEAILQAGRSLVVESNFKPEFDTPKLLSLKKKYDFKPVQIFCRADRAALLKRFRERVDKGERQPGHVDQVTIAEFEQTLAKGLDVKLDIGGTVIEVDTTDFNKIDYEDLLQTVRAFSIGKLKAR